jgi:hypothetical protein
MDAYIGLIELKHCPSDISLGSWKCGGKSDSDTQEHYQNLVTEETGTEIVVLPRKNAMSHYNNQCCIGK